MRPRRAQVSPASKPGLVQEAEGEGFEPSMDVSDRLPFCEFCDARAPNRAVRERFAKREPLSKPSLQAGSHP